MLIVAASRPHPHETVNGDAWAAHWHAGVCRIVVVDGLGHGPEAATAARTAIQTLAARPELPPAEALRVCHQALAGTRGAAITVATIDPAACRLTIAGVGNVEGRLWQEEREQRFMLYRGIVGSATPTVRGFDFDLRPPWLVVLHTDGISARFSLPSLTTLPLLEPQSLADRILAERARAADDATVVIVCSQ